MCCSYYSNTRGVTVVAVGGKGLNAIEGGARLSGVKVGVWMEC
jgi:hypothetical protein